MARQQRATADYRVGQKVTSVAQAFLGVVKDLHYSYVVERQAAVGPFSQAESAPVVIAAADNPDGLDRLDHIQPDDKVISAHVSYLVTRNWDGVDVWVEGWMLCPGHLTDYAAVAKAGASPYNTGARS